MQTIWHDVAGTVQIVDDKTLVIRNFVYDGEGPDAFFTVGVRTRKPNPKDATPIRLILIDLKFFIGSDTCANLKHSLLMDCLHIYTILVGYFLL